jgi:hypothetical protein
MLWSINLGGRPNQTLDQTADRIERSGDAYGPPLISFSVSPLSYL